VSRLAEIAVVALVVLVWVTALADVALWLHAQNATVAAAQEAAVTAARADAGADLEAAAQRGQRVGRSLLQASLGPSAGQVDLQVAVDGEVTRAEATGTWPIAPFGRLVALPLHATASLTRERFRPWTGTGSSP
jgi:hypothetical protein